MADPVHDYTADKVRWEYDFPSTANAAGEVRPNTVTSTGLLADESKGE